MRNLESRLVTTLSVTHGTGLWSCYLRPTDISQRRCCVACAKQKQRVSRPDLAKQLCSGLGGTGHL